MRATGPAEVVHDRPWATVYRVPIGTENVWFKACAEVQAFEPRLTAQLYQRWPDRVAEVIAHDERRRWLLLADAGIPIAEVGNPPDFWLHVLPRYAEMQIGEAAYADEHLSHGVPDLRLGGLPERYEELMRADLPLRGDEIRRLAAFAPRFGELGAALDAYGLPPTVQHDDLHMRNVYQGDDTLRVLDWGDASIAHPFASLVVTFRFLEEFNGVVAGDPWFDRLRDAYLEPWGNGLSEAFELGLRVGTFTHAIAWSRQRKALPHAALHDFDRGFAHILRRALLRTGE